MTAVLIPQVGGTKDGAIKSFCLAAMFHENAKRFLCSNVQI